MSSVPSCNSRSSNGARTVLAALLLCAGMNAGAQPVYKSVDADGRITYTDRPPQDPMPRTGMSTQTAVADALARNAVLSSSQARSVDVREAARSLAEAQRQLSEGARPLPGERIEASAEGTPKNRYQRRQDRLRAAVEQAQRRLNETRR